jgi:hypothetical protein
MPQRVHEVSNTVPPTVDAVFHYARSDSNLGDLVGSNEEDRSRPVVPGSPNGI